MSFIDQIWDQIKIAQEAIDGWVAKNVSRSNQNIAIVTIFFAMIVHLVYTKRKLTREAREQQKEKEEKENSRMKKKVKWFMNERKFQNKSGMRIHRAVILSRSSVALLFLRHVSCSLIMIESPPPGARILLSQHSLLNINN